MSNSNTVAALRAEMVSALSEIRGLILGTTSATTIAPTLTPEQQTAVDALPASVQDSAKEAFLAENQGTSTQTAATSQAAVEAQQVTVQPTLPTEVLRFKSQMDVDGRSVKVNIVETANKDLKHTQLILYIGDENGDRKPFGSRLTPAHCVALLEIPAVRAELKRYVDSGAGSYAGGYDSARKGWTMQ